MLNLTRALIFVMIFIADYVLIVFHNLL